MPYINGEAPSAWWSKARSLEDPEDTFRHCALKVVRRSFLKTWLNELRDDLMVDYPDDVLLISLKLIVIEFYDSLFSFLGFECFSIR